MDNNELLQAIRGIIKEEVSDVVKKELKNVVRINDFEDIMLAFNNRLDTTDNTLNKMNVRLDKMDGRLSKIELTIENDINRNIQALHEGFEGITKKLEKLDKIEEDVEDLKMRTEIIEGYIKENTYINN